MLARFLETRGVPFRFESASRLTPRITKRSTIRRTTNVRTCTRYKLNTFESSVIGKVESRTMAAGNRAGVLQLSKYILGWPKSNCFRFLLIRWAYVRGLKCKLKTSHWTANSSRNLRQLIVQTCFRKWKWAIWLTIVCSASIPKMENQGTFSSYFAALFFLNLI